MQVLFSLFFDKKLYFYCFSALCKNDVYYKLIHSKKCIVKTGFIFLFALKRPMRLCGRAGLFLYYSKFLPN